METNGSYFAIWVMIIHLLFSFSALSFNNDHHLRLLHDPIALDSFLHNQTYSSIPKVKSGVPHKIHLPTNFSGIELSIVRMRSIVIWTKGARFEPLFNIPPKILTSPIVMTLMIMYENLGNFSSYYYNLPQYSFHAPVIGLTFYNANDNRKVNVSALHKPITINFTTIRSPGFNMTHETKCVRLDLNGHVELSEMVSPNICTSQLQGHFSIVSPVVHLPPSRRSTPISFTSTHHRRKKFELWYWWVIGFGAGLFGIILVALLAMIIFRSCMLKRIKWMEKISEKSEVLDTKWIRDSKLPCASMIRTQPSLENDFTP